jgi:hypothetical protein
VGAYSQTQLDMTAACAQGKVARDMFGFLRKGPSPAASNSIQHALVQAGLPLGMSVDRLRVLTRQGNYAGRSVRYFSAFDAEQALHVGVAVRTFKDLDAHPDLIIGSGHVERDGAISLTRRESSSTSPSPARAQADRAGHGDDTHLVFWDAQGSPPKDK